MRLLLIPLFSLIFLLADNSSASAAVCDGTPSRCDSRTDKTSCNGQSGDSIEDNACDWDSTKTTPCTGDSGSDNCSSYGRSACLTIPGCIWLVSADRDDNALSEVVCNALGIVTGTGGKAFAAFAVISMGIGFFTGKVSWGLMIGICAGIGAMFGAPTIVAAIAGDDAVEC